MGQFFKIIYTKVNVMIHHSLLTLFYSTRLDVARSFLFPQHTRTHAHTVHQAYDPHVSNPKTVPLIRMC